LSLNDGKLYFEALEDDVAIQFQHNYQLLELKSDSDWAMAKKNYRRLVHACHPDRFAQKPRERMHAQQQFIERHRASE